jgi:N-acetyl-1-D-myo-inositol-2-amino-2-deoxy-alpha-D-glucopyranoside deacetylase
VTRRILAVHAHPDDESITMGGTLAGYAARGVGVTLVTATLGEQGEVMPADVVGADGLPGLGGLTAEHADQLGGYRLAELGAACDALGVADHRLLGGIGTFRDSGMAGSASAAHPRAFVRASAGGPDHERAVALLASVLAEVRPDAVLTYDTDGGYGHPDHIAAHQVAVTAARRCAVPRVLAVVRPRVPFAAALATVDPPDGFRRATQDQVGTLVDAADVDIAVPVGPWAAARGAALAAHRTQLTVLPGGFALTNVLAQPLLDHECFRVLSGPGAGTGAGEHARLGPEAGVLAGKAFDLFAGLPG